MKRWSLSAAWLAVALTAVPVAAQTSFTPIRINVGGPSYTDSASNVWSADTGYNTGNSYTGSPTILGTSDPALFQSGRWDSATAPELKYSFAVPNGNYEVKLHFAETNPPTFAVGTRIFHVQLEGVTTFSNLDVYAEAGANTALTKSATVRVADGQIDIEFLHGPIENPFVNAIEILGTTGPLSPVNFSALTIVPTEVDLRWASNDPDAAQYLIERCEGVGCSNFVQIATTASTAYADVGVTPSTTYRYRVRAQDSSGGLGGYSSTATVSTSKDPGIRINAGGPAYTDAATKVWSADTGYNTGNASLSGAAIAGTSDPALFQSARWDPSAQPELEYSIAVPDGWYQVNLLFAETNTAAFAVGSRVFHVEMEGTRVFENLDVYAEAGANTALIKSASVRVVDGQMNIRFLHGAIENPSINAIEILPSEAPSAPTGFSVQTSSSTQLNLGWTASTDDVAVAQYLVERCPGATCSNFIRIAAVSTPGYADSGLTPSTIYRYRVRAQDSDEHLSAYSAIASAATKANVPFAGVRVNVGGAAYTDTTGRLWSADFGFNTGNTYTSEPEVAGTNDQPLFRSGRWDSSAAPELQYSLAVPNGSRQVKLYFVESYPGAFGVGLRIFHVQMEGATVLQNLDVYAEAGANTLLTKTVNTNVLDGQLNITILHGPIENTFINAIEVVADDPNADTQAPSTPAGLTVSRPSATQTSLSWSLSTDNIGVAAYSIERCQGVVCNDFVAVGTSNSVAFTDSNLSAAAHYRYRIRARDVAGNFSAYSILINALPYSLDIEPPSIPAGFAVTVDSTTQATLSWLASTDNVGVVAYSIERCGGAACSNFAELRRVPATGYVDLELAPAGSYRYRIRAVDAASNYSNYSQLLAATTPAAPADAENPTAPATISAAREPHSQIRVTWSAASDDVGVASYLVERCQGAGCSDFVQIATCADTTFVDTQRAASTTYSYRVRAKDVANKLSVYSAIASVSTSPLTITYSYDNLQRLIQATASDGSSITYTYDENGNVLTITRTRAP